MGVSGVAILPPIARLESPDVVTELGAAEQSGFAQVVQIAKEGRFVEAEFCQSRGDFRMGQRSTPTSQKKQR